MDDIAPGANRSNLRCMCRASRVTVLPIRNVLDVLDVWINLPQLRNERRVVRMEIAKHRSLGENITCDWTWDSVEKER